MEEKVQLLSVRKDVLAGCDEDQACQRCQAIATAAHDLKTPLAVLHGYLDLLASHKLGPLNPKQESVLREMTASAERLRRFTDEFLTYYGVQAGIKLRLEEHDLNECVADTVTMWTPQFTKKNLPLYWLPDKNLPKFSFDYHKVQHIVSNLLDNACKFTPQRGSVWVRTGSYFWERRNTQQCYSGLDRRGKRTPKANCARIDVSDTGPGIAPENLQEIFEEFRQVAGTQGKRHGMGLGLAIAKRLTEIHKGKIWVESTLGKGSQFSIVLPYDK
jgi:signal transduction histidine kinase